MAVFEVKEMVCAKVQGQEGVPHRGTREGPAWLEERCQQMRPGELKSHSRSEMQGPWLLPGIQLMTEGKQMQREN